MKIFQEASKSFKQTFLLLEFGVAACFVLPDVSMRYSKLFFYCILKMSSFFAAYQRFPGPHEVVFYSETEDSPGVMLWRYPEPRVLTFVRITPVPFNTTEDPEISTADLGDALQVEMEGTNVNMLVFQHKPQLVVK